MSDKLEKVSMFFGGKKHRLGAIEIDALIKESHEFRSQVTEHPVESGEAFIDHIYQLPMTVHLEGIITNTPNTLIGFTAFDSLHAVVTGKSNDIAEQAFKKIEEIFSKREPINIASSLKVYTNMVLESLNVERGGASSESLHFRCSAREIRVANLTTIAAPEPKEEALKEKKNLGEQETKPATEDLQIQSKSLLTALLGNLGG